MHDGGNISTKNENNTSLTKYDHPNVRRRSSPSGPQYKTRLSATKLGPFQGRNPFPTHFHVKPGEIRVLTSKGHWRGNGKLYETVQLHFSPEGAQAW